MPPGPLAQPRPALRLRCASSSEPSQAPRHRNLQGTRSPPLDAQTRATAPLWLLPGGTAHQGHASVPSCPSWTAHVAGKPRGPTRVGRANRARPGRQSVLALWQGVRLAFSGPPMRATTATVAPTRRTPTALRYSTLRCSTLLFSTRVYSTLLYSTLLYSDPCFKTDRRGANARRAPLARAQASTIASRGGAIMPFESAHQHARGEGLGCR